MVSTTRSRMEAAARHAFDDLFVIHSNFHHMVNGNTGITQRFSLRNGARETVKQETVGAVILLDTLLDQVDDDVIRHQTTRFHDVLHLQAQRGTCLDGSTQHVASGNLWNTELFGNEACLGTFTGTGRSQQNHAHFVLLLMNSFNCSGVPGLHDDNPRQHGGAGQPNVTMYTLAFSRTRAYCRLTIYLNARRRLALVQRGLSPGPCQGLAGRRISRPKMTENAISLPGQALLQKAFCTFVNTASAGIAQTGSNTGHSHQHSFFNRRTDLFLGA